MAEIAPGIRDTRLTFIMARIVPKLLAGCPQEKVKEPGGRLALVRTFTQFAGDKAVFALTEMTHRTRGLHRLLEGPTTTERQIVIDPGGDSPTELYLINSRVILTPGEPTNGKSLLEPASPRDETLLIETLWPHHGRNLLMGMGSDGEV